MLESVERKLPPEYAGWDRHKQELRERSTRELIEEVQDGPPDRRLAAISVIDLASVPEEVLTDWVRTLPDPEANELAGAIPAQRPHASVEADMHWIKMSRFGYEKRRLPTFLVTLLQSVEAVEAKAPASAGSIWSDLGPWAADGYRRFVSEGDDVAIEDLLLFVFENHLDRQPMFDAFVSLVREHEDLATRIAANPALYLAGLSLESQKKCLEAAGESGAIGFDEAWRALHSSPLL